MPIFILLLTGVAGLLISAFVRRADELFSVTVKNGRLHVNRGSLPPSALHAMEDVVRRANVRSGTIRAVLTEGQPRLVLTDVSEDVAQRLRNVFGVYALQNFKGASRFQTPKREA